MADGWITIGTKLSTDKFDKQISELEKKMSKEEDKKIVIEAKLDKQQQELDIARKKTDELADAYQRLKQAQDKVASGRATPQEYSTMQGIEQSYGSLEKIGANFDIALTKQNAIEQKVAQIKNQYEALNSKVDEYKTKINSVKLQRQKAEVDGLKSSINGVGNSLQKAIKKASVLALSIFGIRSAYLALRRASSDLANYDQQYATNLEYIRYALTMAIAPVLRWIVQMAMQALQIINMIVNALFGVNLFSSGSAENFNKMKQGASGVAGAVKEIKKQLTGFDEINVLTDQSDTGTSAGAGGVSMPDFDLSALNAEPPKWLTWILKNKDLILSVLAGIATGLLAMKLGLSPLKSLGLAMIIGGIVYAIQGLIAYLKDPSWENFGKVIQGIGVAIIGLGALIIGLPAVIIGAIVLIFGTIVRYWEQIKAFLQNGVDWLTNKSEWVHGMFGDVIGNIYDGLVNFLQIGLNWLDTFFSSVKGMFDGFIKFFKGIFTGDWKMAFEGLKQIATNIINIIVNTIVTQFKFMQNAVQTVINTIKSFFSGLVDKVTGWFSNMGETVSNTIGEKFKSIINGILSAVENLLNKPIGAINSMISKVNEIPGVKISKFNTINLGRLKTGGIINMPNKGTLLGGASAIGGESGAEGVIPLTDQQAMAQLGQEIGRHVLINLTNVTTMNGRILAREIKQVTNEQQFAYNS